ncbi:MAG: cysteine--tRNA ligase [Candidatus Saccharibacteria bacterium]
MTLKFHNTLTNQVDEFASQNNGKVTIYTCGPTVYDYPHIGNWASYIYWDVLIRILMANDYEVNRVINITDVGHLTSDADEGEDKLEKGAKREGKTAWEIAAFYTEDFMNGMRSLGMIMPQHIAKATDYIPQQLDMIRKLKNKGFTYRISDGIYFETSKFTRYADFAHLKLGSQMAGARVEFNPEKHNNSDFALWKFTPTGEKRDMEWATPADLLDNNSRSDLERSKITEESVPKGEQIVMGFPGWHIECSAIIMALLGETIDIHTGGIDHIPVHHTNEIAQSEAINNVRLSNYWLHSNHLKINGSKISKSLGNGYRLDDLAKKGFSPLDYRMFILQGHYRNEGNFTFEGLQSAKNRLHNWRNIAALRHQIHDTIQSDNARNTNNKTISPYATSRAIIEAIDDDLGTPEALRIIDEAFSSISNARITNINQQALINLLDTIDSTLGLQLIGSTPDISDDLKRIIIERNHARAQKDWSKSDKLRDQLLSAGIIIRDTNSEVIWEYKD